MEHAQELGDAVPENPVLFLKPPSVLKQVNHWGEQLQLDYPIGDSKVQPECEIVIRVGCDGYRMTSAQAQQAISAVTVGLDMTLRDRQTALKQQGHPWTTAKVFKDAAIIGPWIASSVFPNYLNTNFELRIEGRTCQSAQGHTMMMLPEDLLVYISQFFPLRAGDIIFTGTPVGVTSIYPGNIANVTWGQYGYTVIWLEIID